MLEIKQDTDIRQVASLLRTDLKTAAELIITCLLYEATWKLCRALKLIPSPKQA